MEFNDLVEQMKKRSVHASECALTEEATKTSVILPFLQAMGFDIFDLNEVIPEYTADVGIKKGEKVDFALKVNGKVTILVEVKPITKQLGSLQHSQLFRYFSVTPARLAILTNGREVWFFSDIDASNKMDAKPFFTFDLQNYNSQNVHDLSRFRKDDFCLDDILAAAEKLQCKTLAAEYLEKQLKDPDEDFVKLVARQMHSGMLTKSVLDGFRPVVQGALDEVVRRRISTRLNIEIPAREEEKQTSDALPASSDPGDGIVTTEEEIEGFMTVRAIASRDIAAERVTIRDAKSYCGIFVDDNNRRPVCRLYFNTPSALKVAFLDEDKKEVRHPIEKISDLYRFEKEIIEAVRRYSGNHETPQQSGGLHVVNS